MEVDSRLHKLIFWLAMMVIWLAPQTGKSAEGLHDIRVYNFSCTNIPASQAISLLSKSSSYVINAIVDSTNEPLVTITDQSGPMLEILSEIVSNLQSYVVVPKGSTLLVCPKNILNDPSFPPNWRLKSFDVEYDLGPTGRINGCGFTFQSPRGSLNTGVSYLHFRNEPAIDRKQPAEHFENQTLIEILTALSVKWHLPWYCGRMRQDFIRRYNKRMAEFKLTDTSTWWPDENSPGYVINWGEGAEHGDYAYKQWVTDAQGNSHWQGISFDETVRKEEQQKIKHEEDVARWAHFKTIEDSIWQGMHSGQPSPVQVHAEIAVPEISNQTAAVEVSLTITNTTPGVVKMTNPYRGDLQQAFWSIRVERKGDGAQYEVALPEDGMPQEPADLLLGSYSASTHVVDILGAKTLLDEKYTNAGFPGPVADELKKPGEYAMTVWLYFREPSGLDHCVVERRDFEIK